MENNTRFLFSMAKAYERRNSTIITQPMLTVWHSSDVYPEARGVGKHLYQNGL
jgi:hypothetical protein